MKTIINNVNSFNSLINPCIINTFTGINAIDQFVVEDVNGEIHTPTQSLNGGVIKKFTSLATTSTIFRWKFGDTHQNPIVETTENPYYHTFREAGTYLINHQSCYPCGGQLVCSNGWCTKSITITPPGKDLTALAIGSIFGFLIFKGIDCEDRDTKQECDELRDYCQWVEKEKKCARKCNKGYKLEKEDSKNSKVLSPDDIKRPSKLPSKLRCVPTRERPKEKSKSLKEKK